MEWLVQHPENISKLGRASRQLAEEVFDVRMVNAQMLSAMNLHETHEKPALMTWAGPETA